MSDEIEWKLPEWKTFWKIPRHIEIVQNELLRIGMETQSLIEQQKRVAKLISESDPDGVKAFMNVVSALLEGKKIKRDLSWHHFEIWREYEFRKRPDDEGSEPKHAVLLKELAAKFEVKESQVEDAIRKARKAGFELSNFQADKNPRNIRF